MKKIGKLTIGLVAVVVGVLMLLRPLAVYRFFHPTSRREVIERVFKDEAVFNVVTNSVQVTAQRLHRKSDGDPDLLSGYNRDAPVALSPDRARQIKNLLQNPWSYLWDVQSSCLPDYGVLFNFESGSRTVHVAFCFKCNIIGVFNGDNDTSNSIAASQFDPMRGKMIALSKTLFPNDSEIQTLK